MNCRKCCSMLLSIDTSVHQNIVGLLWNMWNGMKWMTKWLTKKRQPAKHSPKHSQSNNRGWTKIQNTEANVVDSWYFFLFCIWFHKTGRFGSQIQFLRVIWSCIPELCPLYESCYPCCWFQSTCCRSHTNVGRSHLKILVTVRLQVSLAACMCQV